MNASNESRLDQLYRDHRPDLLHYFRRRHGSDEIAEDLLQETFAGVMKHPERLLEAELPRAYLFGIARCVSADAFHKRRLTEPLDNETAQECEPEDSRLEAMREAIPRLNPTLRQILELRLEREMSYEQMAEALGIPVGTVRSRLHHAVKSLSALMKNYE